jgi:hypothetical protein
MSAVGTSPVGIRRESKYACDIAQNSIGPARSKERIMTAIMEEDTDAQQEKARGDGQGKENPV